MSTKTIKKYFCDGCGVETTENAFSTMPWDEKPITYVVRQRRVNDSDLEMDLCETCQHALAKAIDQMHGVAEEEEDERVDEEEEIARIHRRETAEYRLALIENAWVEASNLAEVKGPIEEGILAMARELYSHRCPWA